MADSFSQIDRWLESKLPQMIELQRLLTAIPALGPENGGDGELKKAEALCAWLDQQGLKNYQRIDATDQRVSSRKRPNILLPLSRKEKNPAFWIMSHLDVVPAGDFSLWSSPPFKMQQQEGRVYGRGVEDNQQGLVASIFAALACREFQLGIPKTAGLLFVSDEESGSHYGIEHIIKQNIFKADDYFLVPDGGISDGSMIETAEKSILWLRFEVLGKQCHASMPEKGINTALAAGDLTIKLYHSLKNKFKEQNAIFSPPLSTFTPTKREKNVDNINTVPGRDVFYFDCRILPEIPLSEVKDFIIQILSEKEKEYKVQINLETIQEVSSVASDPESPFVRQLQKAIDEVYHIKAKAMGIGGGTVASFLRNRGHQTLVWSKIEESMHMPDEYCVLANLLGDAKVMARLLLENP